MRAELEIKIKLRTLIVLCLVLVAGAFLLFKYPATVVAKSSGDTDVYEELKIFTDVLALVRKNYVEEVAFSKLVEGAVKGMLVTLDPHSGYLSPDTYKELQVETKGSFGGLGIEITVKDGLLTVVAPIEDSPAFRAGVQPGDQIIKIGDEFTKDLSLIDAVKKMRGPKGTPIQISVHRDGTQGLIPITVVRDVIAVKSIRYRKLEPGYAYVRLSQFQEGSATEFAKALSEMEKESPDGTLRGLVVDLRNNPGGLLTQAIRVADIFMEEGVVVYTGGRLESQKQKYFAHDGGNEPKYPIVVLVNEGSASASEIVAGALQDQKRALIVGKPTFGKGSVQTILPMENGSALRLTTALFYTMSGRSIQAEGITPDVIVSARRYPSDSEELLEEEKSVVPREKNLPGAIKNPQAGDDEEEEDELTQSEYAIGSRTAMNVELEKLLQDDPQLEEALRLLKTWYVFQRTPGVEAKAEDSVEPKA